MKQRNDATAAVPATLTGRGLFLLCGPWMAAAALYAAVLTGHVDTAGLPYWLAGIAALFAPAPLSLPGLLMDTDRDNAAAATDGAGPVTTWGWMLRSPHSRVRADTAATLLSWAGYCLALILWVL